MKKDIFFTQKLRLRMDDTTNTDRKWFGGLKTLIYSGTVDGRNPKQPLGMYKTSVNNGITVIPDVFFLGCTFKIFWNMYAVYLSNWVKIWVYLLFFAPGQCSSTAFMSVHESKQSVWSFSSFWRDLWIAKLRRRLMKRTPAGTFSLSFLGLFFKRVGTLKL